MKGRYNYGNRFFCVALCCDTLFSWTDFDLSLFGVNDGIFSFSVGCMHIKVYIHGEGVWAHMIFW